MRVLLFFLMVFLPAAVASAATVQRDDGKVFEGRILDDDGTYLYLETEAGVVNIEKNRIKSADGRDFDAEADAMLLAEEAEESAGTLGLEGPLAAKVGPGGITEKEFKRYQDREAEALKKDPSELSADERERILKQAIGDEMIFQEALGQNLHHQSRFRHAILEQFKNERRKPDIQPQDLSADELHDYYDRHPEKFMFPAQYRFKVFSLNSPAGTLKGLVEKAKKNPASIKGWKSEGWVPKGDMLHLPFSNQIYDEIYAMKKGQVEKFESGVNESFLLWLTDERPAKRIPYQSAVEQIRHEMIKERLGDNEEALEEEGPLDENELFVEALQAGVHREPVVREALIQELIAQNGGSRQVLLLGLREKYSFEILKDFNADAEGTS